MNIQNHILFQNNSYPCRFVKTENHGGEISPKFVIIHYTAGPSIQSAINTFCNSNSKASAHIIIGMDGEVVQMVPFNCAAWHAGISSWDGLTGLNEYSIGIEFVNAGRLEKVNDKWRPWFEKDLYSKYGIDCVELVHQHEKNLYGWQKYPDIQIESGVRVLCAIQKEYNIHDKNVIGHEDIAPGRKCDPGPAFPWHVFLTACKE